MKKINIPTITSIEEQGLNTTTIIKSVLISYGLSIVLLAIFAIILTYTSFPESSIPTVVLVVSILSILYAGKLSAKKAKSRGWLAGSITGLLYMVILYLISLTFTQRAVFDSYVILIFILGLITGAVGGIIGINLKKPEKRFK